MRGAILPKSLLGWSSMGLIIVSIIFFTLSVVILGPGPDYNMSLAYALTAIVVGIAIASFVTGLMGVIKKKERAILVFIAMAISLYCVIGSVVSLIGSVLGLTK